MFHIHRYRTVADTGVTEYGQCRCGKRRARQGMAVATTGDRRMPPSGRSGYQPVDWAWLNRETDELFRPMGPPPGPSNMIIRTPNPFPPPKDVTRQ